MTNLETEDNAPSVLVGQSRRERPGNRTPHHRTDPEPSAGLDVIAKIEEKCSRYAEFPEGGTACPDLGPGLRCFPVGSLLVIYRPIEDGIAIILVAHGHQDVRTIVERIFGGEE